MGRFPAEMEMERAGLEPAPPACKAVIPAKTHALADSESAGRAKPASRAPQVLLARTRARETEDARRGRTHPRSTRRLVGARARPRVLPSPLSRPRTRARGAEPGRGSATAPLPPRTCWAAGASSGAGLSHEVVVMSGLGLPRPLRRQRSSFRRCRSAPAPLVAAMVSRAVRVLPRQRRHSALTMRVSLPFTARRPSERVASHDDGTPALKKC